MKFIWCTDIHLNFIDLDDRVVFYKKLAECDSDGVFITGDIAEAPVLEDILIEMTDHIKLPIYFVVGNHDYYRGQVKEVRDVLTNLTRRNDYLFWLPSSGIHHLNGETVLLGQDGWADGRLGDYTNSRVALNDSRMIADLFQAKILGKYPLLDKMQSLADADAMALHDDLVKVIAFNPKKVIVLTHIPPFKESCLHEGKISDDDWLPYFSSKIMGDVLIEVANKNPGIDFLVLCGHTHDASEYHPLDNLTVKAGGAEYGYPVIAEVIQL